MIQNFSLWVKICKNWPLLPREGSGSFLNVEESTDLDICRFNLHNPLPSSKMLLVKYIYFRPGMSKFGPKLDFPLIGYLVQT